MDDKTREDGGFLARWSRRKRGTEAEEEPDITDPDAAEPAVGEISADAEPDTDDVIDPELEENRLAAEAVDIDALTYADDFKLFMKPGVPAMMRQKALRKLWRSNPILANIDGLNDYDDNFGDPKLNVYKSMWEIGRGFLSKAEQLAQQDTGTFNPPRVADETEETQLKEETAAVDGDPDSGDAPDESFDESAEVVAVAEAPVPVEAADDDSEKEPEPPKRVSIRRRLEG
jgi:Protein of unknown function (DUF3306)